MGDKRGWKGKEMVRRELGRGRRGMVGMADRD